MLNRQTRRRIAAATGIAASSLILPQVPALAMPERPPLVGVGHNGGPPITDADVTRAVERARGAGLDLPFGDLPGDASLAMLMMARMAGATLQGAPVGGGGVKPQTVFSATTYTGDNDYRNIVNGLDLLGSGGLVWIKSRQAYDHALYDTARGAQKSLVSNKTDAQYDVSSINYAELLQFRSDGFRLGLDYQQSVNGNTIPYVAWSFRRAAKFFDVVTYTGNGVAGRQIAHALGVAPGMVIVKRTNGLSDWSVYHRITGPTGYMLLNGNNTFLTDSTQWNNTAPSSTGFTVGNAQETNASGATYVAYLFAHDTDASGIVQCGSWATASETVTLGWKPQFVMVKSTSAAENWLILDTARGLGMSSNVMRLYPNLSSAENTISGFRLELTSTGFINREYNGPCVYIAIREPIF